jgi:menaquinone-dependent protoporphyrinogen IX oxidase
MTDSWYGNGKILAQTLKDEFKNGHEVFIDDVKEITPEKVVKRLPDAIILGGAIRMFRGDPKSKSWLKKLNHSLLNTGHKIRYGTGFLTHALPTKRVQGYARRYISKVENSSEIENTYSTLLTARVQSEKGPIDPAEMEKAKEYIREFIAWINN